jgi:hypothetical protein
VDIDMRKKVEERIRTKKENGSARNVEGMGEMHKK